MRSATLLSGLAAVLAGCGDLQGVGGPATPLATFPIQATGNLTTSPTSLQIALVWGAQWWTEPLCILPPESDAVRAVLAAGCRDPFGFVPAQVGVSVPVLLDQPTTLSLNALPTASLLVGGVTSRVGYASFVLYDDRDNSGTLELSSPRAAPSGGRDRPDDQPATDSSDVIYGASFVTMTAPDVRVSYIEGTYALSAFYPRKGCDDETDGFAIEGAGGFSAADALAASAAGTIPSEDPSTCTHAKPPDFTLVTVPAGDPATVVEVGCSEPTLDGSVRYRQPPTTSPDLDVRPYACAHLPSLGTTQSDPGVIQLVVAGLPGDRCMGLTHYTLRGCREDVSCAIPDWDFTASPPSWWPCN